MAETPRTTPPTRNPAGDPEPFHDSANPDPDATHRGEQHELSADEQRGALFGAGEHRSREDRERAAREDREPGVAHPFAGHEDEPGRLGRTADDERPAVER